MMTEKIYKDKFTLDGRLNPRSYQNVTPRKVAAIKQLWESGMRGNGIDAARFKESISTSDAIFNATYLTNIQVLEQFDELPRTWTQIAGVRELPDFRNVVLYSMFNNGFEGLRRDDALIDNPEGIAPVVAEGETYPYATVGEVEAAYGRLRKRGFKVGWTWEAQINDAIGFFSQIPGEMLNVAGDTEEYEVYQALLNGATAASDLTGGTIYTGETVVANAPFSKNALVRLLFEISQRQINGRYIGNASAYNLIVPVGTSPAVNFALSNQIIQTQDGSFVLSQQDQPLAAAITVVESEWVTGTAWYLVPKPGTTKRPVLELGRLRGQASPELRVDNHTGNYAGGASVPPFEGSFNNDTIDMRLRYPLTGILWSETFIGWSTGAGS
jgi:hypothetical protein